MIVLMYKHEDLLNGVFTFNSDLINSLFTPISV